MKKIAIVGAGISGLTAAYLLSRQHQVTVFEAENYIGGHTRTVTVERPEKSYQVDTGFIVFNDHTYPNFTRLLQQLRVKRQLSEMSFSVHHQDSGYEYSGTGINGFFGQRRNLLRPQHWRLLRDILRFNKQAPELLKQPDNGLTLGDYLQQQGYSQFFIERYILAMGGAIWSCSHEKMARFPAHFFVRFFDHHGLLSVNDQPQWFVIPGGSKSYLAPLLQASNADVRQHHPVTAIRRTAQGVTLTSKSGNEQFDDVILACHSDQAQRLLQDITASEKSALSALPYQENEVVLHTDSRLLPNRPRLWSSWNAWLPKQLGEQVEVTYNMNLLQGIDAPVTFCVTLNASERIDESKIIGRYRFFHPLFTPQGLASRSGLLRNMGDNHTWFCGAWCGNGFHEDGVVSALNVARAFGEQL